MARIEGFAVVGIELGKYESWIAFSFRDRYNDIFSLNKWGTQSREISLKTPTALLLNPDQSFRAFGIDAEITYAKMDETTKKEHFFFQYFNMPRPGILEDKYTFDRSEKQLETLYIFSVTLAYFKDLSIQTLQSRSDGITEEMISYVVTLPDGSSDISWRFLREAAFQATIKDTTLAIVTESEAIATYFKSKESQYKETGYVELSPNELYLILYIKEDWSTLSLSEHVGGGLVDQTKNWVDTKGLNSVYQAFETVMERVLGEQWEHLKSNTECISELRESIYRKAHRPLKESTNILLGCDVDLGLADNDAAEKQGIHIIRTCNGLKIKEATFSSFFSEMKMSLGEKMSSLIRQYRIPGKTKLMLSGIISDFIVQYLKHEYPILDIYVPVQPETVCLKGAVLSQYLRSPVNAERGKLLSVAIDLGTTYSGYAYSYKSDPERVITPQWSLGGGGIRSNKTSTSLLLNPDKSFRAFGYNAEEEFARLSESNDDCNGFYFFHRFKMELYHKKLYTLQHITRYMQLTDETGKKFDAISVFSFSIEYLKNHMLSEINNQLTEKILASDIQWVITIPAIWNDYAKSFMHEAANKAGIPSENLLLALEPEAASICCQQDRFEKQMDFESTMKRAIKPGTSYLVVDVGGGTTDIMAHRRNDDTILPTQVMTGLYLKGGNENEGSRLPHELMTKLHMEEHSARSKMFRKPLERSICLEELIPSTGGSYGGNDVDKQVLEFFDEVCGKETMLRFKNKYIDDYMDILQKLEVAKRQLDVTKKNPIQLNLPLSLINSVKKDETKKNLKNALALSRYAGNVTIQGSKLRFSNGSFEAFFLKTVNGIVEGIGKIFSENPAIKMDSIVLVGGLSECNALISAVKNRFPDKKLIVPEEAGLSVLKGAVYFGHNPAAVTKRVSRYTYGIRGEKDSDFRALIKRGEQVERGKKKAWVDNVTITGNSSFAREIFVSEVNDVRSIMDSKCRCLGTLRVPLYNMGVGTKIEITGYLEVGLTELKIKAEYNVSGIPHEVMFEIFD